GLAHMRAACVQQLRHLRLVGVTVEPRLHCLRRNRHLAQRQRGRKYLDEEGFHQAFAGARAIAREAEASPSSHRDKMAFCEALFVIRENNGAVASTAVHSAPSLATRHESYKNVYQPKISR